MRLLLAFPVLLVAEALAATDPPPQVEPIRLPVVPAPLPPPAPATVTALTGGQLYVVDCDVPCLVLASPAGIVSIANDAGPVKIRGTFVDGSGKPESRTYRGKTVYTVEAVASGRVELLVVPAGAAATDVLRRTLDVSVSPGPQPQPKPAPEPAPTPVNLWGFVVVEDTSDAVAVRGGMLADPALAALLKSKGYRWRIVDQHVAGADGNPPADVVPCLTAAKGKPLPQVFLIDTSGTIVAQAALTGASQVVELLKKFSTIQ